MCYGETGRGRGWGEGQLCVKRQEMGVELEPGWQQAGQAQRGGWIQLYGIRRAEPLALLLWDVEWERKMEATADGGCVRGGLREGPV